MTPVVNQSTKSRRRQRKDMPATGSPKAGSAAHTRPEPLAAPNPARISLVPIFFFQAEDGIRAGRVTGVQTCALPICGDLGSGVNELLVQMQSFEEATPTEKLLGKLVDAVNLFLPAHRQLPGPVGKPANIDRKSVV